MSIIWDELNLKHKLDMLELPTLTPSLINDCVKSYWKSLSDRQLPWPDTKTKSIRADINLKAHEVEFHFKAECTSARIDRSTSKRVWKITLPSLCNPKEQLTTEFILQASQLVSQEKSKILKKTKLKSIEDLESIEHKVNLGSIIDKVSLDKALHFNHEHLINKQKLLNFGLLESQIPDFISYPSTPGFLSTLGIWARLEGLTPEDRNVIYKMKEWILTHAVTLNAARITHIVSRENPAKLNDDKLIEMTVQHMIRLRASGVNDFVDWQRSKGFSYVLNRAIASSTFKPMSVVRDDIHEVVKETLIEEQNKHGYTSFSKFIYENSKYLGLNTYCLEFFAHSMTKSTKNLKHLEMFYLPDHYNMLAIAFKEHVDYLPISKANLEIMSKASGLKCVADKSLNQPVETLTPNQQFESLYQIINDSGLNTQYIEFPNNLVNVKELQDAHKYQMSFDGAVKKCDRPETYVTEEVEPSN